MSHTDDMRARVAVRLPGPLRELAGGAVAVAVEAATVGEALDALVARHPGLRRHLWTDDGSLREHVNVFLNEEDIRSGAGEASRVAEGDEVTVVPSIAGG